MAPLPLPTLFGTIGTLLVTGIYYAWVRSAPPAEKREVRIPAKPFQPLW